MNSSFFWHDYETFGIDPRRDRPAQFAGIRTDDQLNIIGEPVMLYCQPANDYLPDPASCLITGITPQLCLARGLPEHAFAAQIQTLLGQPGTIGVGYNTIRFDDEFTRHLFWRNLMDPYAREWQNGCGRWDLLDVLRMAYALRPDGIVWPAAQQSDAKGYRAPVSFKLTDLTAANGIAHAAAHDALSDVQATLEMARLLLRAQPKLFAYALSLHKKDRVAAELGLPCSPPTARPFLHVSGMFAAEHGCLAVMWPLASHPQNKNELLAWNLAHDPRELAELDAAQLRQRLFTKTADLPAGLSRLPIKSIHLNKSPMVVGKLNTLRPDLAERWGIDIPTALQHAALAAQLPDMSALWPEVFARPPAVAVDVDEDLYGGFIGDADRRRLNRLRILPAGELALERAGFDDERLSTVLFRYRARNFPSSLSAPEHAEWQAHRAARLLQGDSGARTVEALLNQLDDLAGQDQPGLDERSEEILGALYDYAHELRPEDKESAPV